jgi:hypothetical protein
MRLDLLHMLLTPVLILAAALMTVSFVAGPVERVLRSDLDLGSFGFSQLVAWYMLTFFPAALFAHSYRAVTGVGRLRCLALGHAFVLYGTMWVFAGVRAVWRLLARRRSWIKTDRLDEADAARIPAGTRPTKTPGVLTPARRDQPAYAHDRAHTDAHDQDPRWGRGDGLVLEHGTPHS